MPGDDKSNKQFWKPGAPRPTDAAAEQPSSSSKQPKTPKPLAAQQASAKQKTPGSGGNLSKETMRMKFMMRNAEDSASPPAAAKSPAAPLADTSVTKPSTAPRAASGNTANFRWRLPFDAATAAKAASAGGDGVVGEEGAAADLKLHVLARRSFGGFNLAVERAFLEMSDDPNSKANRRIEREAISDKEMANFYRDRVGAQAKGSGGRKRERENTGGKKIPTQISGSVSKRKRR